MATEVDSVLVATLLDGAPIPSGTPLRVRVRVNALPHLEILPPLRCEPHRVHTGPSIREVEPGVVVGSLPGGRRSGSRAVQVEIRLDSAGALLDVRVLRAATDPGVTERAVIVARSLRFHPALLNGRPLPSSVRRTIRFPEADPASSGRRPGGSGAGVPPATD